jgi:hypothetical protein
MFGKRTVNSSLEEAWVCGSQLVCIIGETDKPRDADIISDTKFDEWVNEGLEAGIFQFSDIISVKSHCG